MLRSVRRQIAMFALVVGFTLAGALGASAHVKWFFAFDVAGQPRGLENVLCPDFESLVALAITVLSFGCLVEATSFGAMLLKALDRITAFPRDRIEILIRIVCAAFFVELWLIGGILLTPELKTSSPLIPWLQLAIALGMSSRRTMAFSAAGICALFALSITQYGIFHLLDYPVFLGLAGYLWLTSSQRTVFGWRPVDIVRVSAAVTLMWASVEKWAYPEWSFPLFIVHPKMAMGFDQEYFMRAAGVVEFVLAFALAWSPLVRRAAATILLGMFIGAIAEFGKIDAIGHAPIIVVLLAVVCDNAKQEVRVRNIALAPAIFVSNLVGFLLLYYELHKILFGTSFM